MTLKRRSRPLKFNQVISLGAWQADGPGDLRSLAGEAYVILGRPAFPTSFDLAAGDADVTIYGATAGDRLTEGRIMAAADLTG